MSNVAGAPAQAKTPLYEALDVEDIRHTDDLGSSVGEMAANQYERADALTDGFRQPATPSAVTR